MTPKPHLSAQAWRWAIGWTLAVLLLSSVPYFIAGRPAPADWQFAGFLVNPLDGHSYMAKMRQGFEGDWLFHLTYTPEPHRGAFIFVFYLALGHLAALTHLPLIWIFHLARLAAGFLLAMVAFRFIARVTPHPGERRLAFILLLTASGFGWLGAILGAFPIDLWVPEAFVPYSLYANPHFPLSMALMLIIFLFVLRPDPHFPSPNLHSPRFASTPRALRPFPLLQRILWPGLAALALALILPFALLTVWFVLALFLVYLFWLGPQPLPDATQQQHSEEERRGDTSHALRSTARYGIRRRLPWQQIWPTLGIGFFSAPVIAYDYWVSVSNPVLAGWSEQNVTPAPAVPDFLLGYGLPGFLAIVGGWLIIRQGRLKVAPNEGFVLLWAITTVGLVYLPFDLQRRLITGLHLPLSILAAVGLNRWLDKRGTKLRRRRLIHNGLILVGVLGTLFVWSVPLLGMIASPAESATTALFFLRREEAAALDWLQQNSKTGDVVLASPRLGMFVPGQTGARAFYGHPFETIKAETKRTMVEAFYRGEINTVSPPPDFIIYGPSEQALGRPTTLTEYPVVFSTGNVKIYKVK